MRKAGNMIAVLLLAAGFLFLAHPFLQNARYKGESRKTLSSFSILQKEADSEEYAALYREMQAYNARIYEEKQAGLCDAFSYTTNDFDFQAEGLKDSLFGYLTIPAMNLELPLYIGANEENMAKGATVLNQTSMPIGGDNTNCVIAGHRGYGGSPMFLEIEKLCPGDTVQVTNLWGKLDYTVKKCIVIDAYDVDAVKIVEGQDMLTLITCHPYGRNYQRYVVYCVRDGQESHTNAETKPLAADDLPEGVAYESSKDSIRLERMLLIGGIGIVAGILLFAVIRKKCNNSRLNCRG